MTDFVDYYRLDDGRCWCVVGASFADACAVPVNAEVRPARDEKDLERILREKDLPLGKFGKASD